MNTNENKTTIAADRQKKRIRITSPTDTQCTIKIKTTPAPHEKKKTTAATTRIQP